MGAHKNPDLSSLAPVNHDIIGRKVNFDFSKEIEKYWAGDILLTRLFDSLQIGFPDGEKMFIQSVRYYRDLIKDPALLHDVKQFTFQEAQHGMEHMRYNELLKEQGIDAESMLSMFNWVITGFQKRFPKKFQLAVTVAAEHFTATLAEDFLENDLDVFSDADEVMKAFYTWHGIEEVEHKAVAWEVYDKVAGGGYFTRISAFGFLLLFSPMLIGAIAYMLYVDNKLLDIRVYRRGLHRIFINPGFGLRILPKVGAYFKPTFKPWETGYPKIFHEWKSKYALDNDPMEALASISAGNTNSVSEINEFKSA